MLTIIGGPHVVGESRSARDMYAKEARNLRQIHVRRTKEHLTKNEQRELKDIVFTVADARWVHHPYVDALVITARVANNNIYRLLVDDGIAVDIIYLECV